VRILSEYKVRIDAHNTVLWDSVIQCFSDANLYQTLAYARYRYGNRNTSTILIEKSDEPIAAAVVRICKLPMLPLGMAYVFWGPLWQKKEFADSEHYMQAIHALRQEYVFRRGLVLRIKPFLYEDQTSSVYQKVLLSSGFHPVLYLDRKRTLLINLKKSVEDLRKGLDSKWRGHLSRAERNDLRVIEGTSDDLFDSLQPIHEEIVERKRISDVIGPDTLKGIQNRLLDEQRMRVLLCEHLGRVCAGIIVSAIGSVGITLSRSTGADGRKTDAAYLVQWRALEMLKNEGCLWYDLSGIDRLNNPGTYSYKTGLCGKNGQEIQMVAQYQAEPSKLMRTIIPLVESGRIAMSKRIGFRSMKDLINNPR